MFSVISNPSPIKSRKIKRKDIVSDKTMSEIHSKFSEMEKEGKLKIVRNCSIDELSKIDQDKLHSTEKAMLLYYRNKIK